jgi:hypothetical protein
MTRCRSKLRLAVSVAATLWVMGCGSASKPRTDIGSSSDTKPIASEGGTKSEGGIKSEGGGGKTVLVTYDSKSYTVDVSKPTPVVLDGASYARLSEIVLLALTGKALDTLSADFEGEGGFKPGTKSNCVGLIPVAGDKLAKGYVQVQSLQTRWDDDLGYPGCLAIKGLVKIILASK